MTYPTYDPNDPLGPAYRRQFAPYDDGSSSAGALVTVLAMILFIGAVLWWSGNSQMNVASNDATPAVGMNGPAAPAQKVPPVTPRP
jgi:hypothetical protein